MDVSEFFGSTNPDNPNHYLKRDYLDKAGLDLFRGRFRLDDNPFLPEGYIEALKRNFTGLWYRRFVLGEWCVAEGAIYDFFERKAPYVIPRSMAPIALSRVVGVDYGTNNPTAFLMFGRNQTTKPEVWCEDEYFYDSVKMMKQKTDAEYAVDFFDFIGNRQIDLVIVDPSAASFKLALKAEARERDTFIRIKDADNDVISGIRTQASMLRSGAYAICEHCTNTLREYEGYVWDKKSQLLGVDAPVKKDDHTKDPERYVLHTLFAKSLIDYSRFTKR
jgi:PBSX family phage terminase large subunit